MVIKEDQKYIYSENGQKFIKVQKTKIIDFCQATIDQGLMIFVSTNDKNVYIYHFKKQLELMQSSTL